MSVEDLNKPGGELKKLNRRLNQFAPFVVFIAFVALGLNVIF